MNDFVTTTFSYIGIACTFLFFLYITQSVFCWSVKINHKFKDYNRDHALLKRNVELEAKLKLMTQDTLDQGPYRNSVTGHDNMTTNEIRSLAEYVLSRNTK